MSPTSIQPSPSTPITSPSHPQHKPKHAVITPNYHPYLIHSTSSSILTRSNSSPVQPISSLGGHRSSRSMGSLNYVLDGPGGGTKNRQGGKSDEQKEREKEERRRSLDSPSRPGVRRSGTLPDFLLGTQGKKTVKEIELPLNPKQWTPSELAQYLASTLRTGGPDGTGQTLPAPLVKDIESWVLQQRVSGRDFMRGSADGWGNTTRPPPFLPLLQSIGRKLRRNSLQGRHDSHFFPLITASTADADGSFGAGSILMEEDEQVSEEDEQGVTGVKKMVIALDARSSASETDASASGDEREGQEAVEGLRAQLTGESVGERWKKWEEKAGRVRKVSDVSSEGALADVESSPRVEKASLDHVSNEVEEQEEEKDQLRGGTIKAPPLISSASAQSTGSSDGLTPPPPYTSAFPDHTSTTEVYGQATPRRPEGHDQSMFAITPTPERTAQYNTAALGILTPSPERTPSKAHSIAGRTACDSPHMSNMSQHVISGSNPSATLSRSTPGDNGPRYPTVRSIALSAADDEEEGEGEGEVSMHPAKGTKAWQEQELEGSRWTTARRVTLRPSKVQNVFDERSTREESVQSREGREGVDEKMEELLERIKDLEHKLEAVSTLPPSSEANHVSPLNPLSKTDDFSDEATKVNRIVKEVSILDLLGFGASGSGENDDGLPRRVRELPAYLFFVGVGVGAIMVRVFFRRAR
ncbi:hypothetical protein IAR55_006187 [Kwoniella newhampshirensis]|uniref:Uncharacterized protein n=1 Tax=Kwoniella newhampshirensis TaxID=1651941 RepID=A0AAW0YUW4_9TREE